jgi:multidrug efflux pump subunit AcrA (membrane-fusion protein)
MTNNMTPSPSPVYDPDQMFKLFDHTGKIIASGSMSAVTEPILDSKSRAAAQQLVRDAAEAKDLIAQQQEEAEELRARQVRAFCDGVARLTQRLDVIEQQREEQVRQDEEEEQRRIQDYLDSLPNPDNEPPPHVPGTHFNTGDLHSIPASKPEDEQQLEADQGALPAELRKGAPPESGNYPVSDPAELEYPETQKQRAPVAVSMMSED